MQKCPTGLEGTWEACTEDFFCHIPQYLLSKKMFLLRQPKIKWVCVKNVAFIHPEMLWWWWRSDNLAKKPKKEVLSNFNFLSQSFRKITQHILFMFWPHGLLIWQHILPVPLSPEPSLYFSFLIFFVCFPPTFSVTVF